MIGAGTAHGVHPLDDGRSPFHFAAPPPRRCSSRRTCTRRWLFVPAGEPTPRTGRRRRRAAAADRHDRRRGALAMTATVGRVRRARRAGTDRLAGTRRRAGRRPDRRRRDELPRLPAAARATARGDDAVRPRSSIRGPGRCRRGSRPRSCSSPASASRCSRAAPSATAALVRAPRWTLVRRGLALYGGGLLLDMIWPGTILPYYGAMFVRRRGAVHVAHAAGSSPSASRRRRRRRHRLVAARAPARRARHDVALDAPATGRRAACCSTSPSTAPTRCCRGWRSSVPASSSGASLGDRLRGGRSPSPAAPRCSAWRRSSATPPTAHRAALLEHRPVRAAASCTRPARSGTALAAFGVITWLADRFAGDAGDRAGSATPGAMTLTLYVAHALVFDCSSSTGSAGSARPGSTRPCCSPPASGSSPSRAVWWHRASGIGPLERLYRRLGGAEPVAVADGTARRTCCSWRGSPVS